MSSSPDSPPAARPKVAPLQAVRGMNDVLPDESALWQRLEDAARAVHAAFHLDQAQTATAVWF